MAWPTRGQDSRHTLHGVLFRRDLRGELMRAGFEAVVNLLWIILGASHPGAALVLGPVLFVGPNSFARALANRPTRSREQ
jgi:hypothetical protein